ncbi:hypothetical protein KY284_026560 [Solanum tuberosum]|nr:hypothetical protein KY284_026560 [Solanum tuberosum]
MDDTTGRKSMEQWTPLPSMEMPTKPIEATQLEQNGDTESQGEISSKQGNDKQDLKEVEPGENGDKVIELKKDEIDKATEEWKQALILYIVGESPTIATMERNEVLYSGPHLLNNRPIIVKVWNPEFDFNKEVLQTVPIWVKYPNFPLSCWSMDSLSRISNGLGEPLYANECTTKVDRISFARVLIEMDVARELPRKLKVEDPSGRVFEQAIQYEWVPEYCAKCMQVGHKCNGKEGVKVQRKVTKWQPKVDTNKTKEVKVPEVKEQVVAPREEIWKQTPLKVVGRSSNKSPDVQMMMQNRFGTIQVYEQGSPSQVDCQHKHKKGEEDNMNTLDLIAYAASHLEH